MGTNLILIKANGNRVPIQNRRTATRITSAKQTWALNADDKLNITVESPIAQTYNIGDKLNVFGRDYKLNRLPKVKRTGMHEFSYDLEFEGIQYDLLRVTYDLTIDTTNNKLQDVQGDSLTGDLRRFMSVLISNANRVFPGKWALGACPDTVADKTLTFGEADNCLLVLQNLCGESNFNVEYEIENIDNVYTINLKTKVGQTLPYTFMFGKGRGLYELTRENVSSANIVTRLKVYGSTENITMKYRADRLCLPGKTKAQSYIEKAEAVAKYGIFEGRKDFDVKPTFTGTVSAIVAGNVLQFVDTSFPFDLNEKEPDGVTTKYLIDGLDAKIHFNTGNLAGYDFTVKSYDHATHTFTLNKLTDDRGDVFPSDKSDAFQFAVGNTYKITDIAYSPEIEAQAEEKLAEQGNVYYDQNCQPKVQYGLAVTKQWLESVVDAQDNVIVNVFAPGDYLHIVDAEIDVDKSVRIKSFTRNILDPYDYALTISDLAVTTSTTNRVLSELIDIDKVLTINNLKDPIRARANWRASREVLDMVFDPEGDYYTDKIKPNSIDTLALSVGAKSMQFGLTNTVFQPNYNGNKNVLKWQGGVLTHYTINEESAMSWVLADGQATLENDSDAFYIYAKCPKVGQDGTIVLTKEQHKVDSDATHYYFWIGVLNSVDAETKVRSIALTYGFTMINGRFIKTGRIESADGTTYFDLDNSEIGGRIVFTSNGEEKTLEQLGAEALESKNYINNTLPGLLSGLVTQIDGKVETWFQATDPSLSWVDADTRMKHVGDMWYNTSTKRLYCYASNASNYYWDEVKSQDALDAYEAASQAQDTADGKRRVFVSQPYPPYDVGDLWVQGSTGDIMRCKNARKTGNYNATDWEKASKYTDDSNFNDFVENVYNIDIAKIKNQLDGVVETHFGDVVPTLNNAPANEWTTTALKEEHLGDIYYNNTSGVGYRFGKSGNTYSWFEIRDTGVTEALAAAAKAQDTADSKRRVFVTTPYPPYDIGDLWVQGKSGDLMRCKVAKASGGSYSATDWEKATNYTSDENLDAFIDGVFTDTISELTNQIDGKVESWYLTTDPASEWTTNAIRDKHVGDTWYNLTSKTFSIYVKSGSTYSWKKIEDAEAIAAAEAAAKAQDTADGKRRVFTSQPYPPYDVGDLWAQGSTGDIMRCKTARASGNYSASDWEKASKYTDDSALQDFVNNTYNTKIQELATQIDGKVESWFQTTDPESTWTTPALKKSHIGDMWYHPTNKQLFFYVCDSIVPFRNKVTNNKYFWKRTPNNMKSLIDVWIQNTTTMQSHVGDIWFDTTNNKLYKATTQVVDGATTLAWSDLTEENFMRLFAKIVGYMNDGIKMFTSPSLYSYAYNVNDVCLVSTGYLHLCKVAKAANTSFSITHWQNLGKEFYFWQRNLDQDALDAYEAASQAQDTADGKRRVFVAQPYPPYDVGDLWVDGKDLRRCVTARTSGNYIANDWVVAVHYDNTKTIIDGGLVTSGTIQVAGDNASILAGMTGQGTTAASIRFWAGASFENRTTAPFRVQQDGSVVMEKAIVKGEAHINKGTIKYVTLNDVVINGSIRNAFQNGYYSLGSSGGISVSTLGLQNNNNVVICNPDTSGYLLGFQVPFTTQYNGFRAIIMNVYFNGETPQGISSARAPSGKYFYENGKTSNELNLLPYEAVEMIGFGDASKFYGWIILRRFYLAPDHMRGLPFHISYMGMVKQNGTLVKLKRYDNATVTVTRESAGRYKITINPGFSSVNNYLVFATCDATEAGSTGRFASVYSKSTGSFYIYTGNNNSPNDSGFTFMVVNTTDF